MANRKVQVFFYGSFISLSVLEEAGIKKRAFAPACIQGYEMLMQPHANLHENGDGIVYGILANLTHDELDTLYHSHIETITTATYKPEAMLVHTRGGKIVPALVYVSDDMEPKQAENAYIDKVLKAATSYGFPKWY
ncbi:MAG: gamma-glutamylcyclotransferase, partial [Alphaproteobacteria bacterium]|nr:gamma-glutamylcyclotransferase [Alphaproteobacteria bacterium]